MSNLTCSPVKLAPPTAKKGRLSIDWQRCTVCQVFTTERLCSLPAKGKATFISAVNQRKDNVYRRLVDEYKTVEEAPLDRIKYHKSCYKAFTSKQNLTTFSGNNVTGQSTASCTKIPLYKDDTQSTMSTRSRLPEIDWMVCIFCKYKAFRQDKKIAQAISTAKRVKADMKPIRTHDLSTVSTPDCDEDLILHNATGILRMRIDDVVIQSDAYPSPADTSSIQWFTSYLADRHQVVSISNVSTLKGGVPQGSVFGPMLFLIFTNDLPLCIPNHNTDRFGDDSTISVIGKDKRYLSPTLNVVLENIFHWVDENKMLVKKLRQCV
ncbi:Hypothetical predicted protein [Mytilus galloprovincialis]|uniref:Reverse transcriptase domain-containing protein n=1 Tax=Mytilus galloprovincialis TaxID=29158 RepID=A0A8B6C087_MYTGA|nr:Hypothetical predicted protein [Mytilus galloprovincialis]